MNLKEHCQLGKCEMMGINATVTNEKRLDEIPDGYERDVLCGGLIKKPTELTQSELIEAITDAVCNRLEPVLERIQDQSNGVLVGSYQIAKYMGLKASLNKSGTLGSNTTIVKWFKEYGFPMFKNGMGRWCISRAVADNWMFGISVEMRKLKELGYKPVARRGAASSNPPLHRYTAEQRSHAIREIAKDRVRMAVDNG